MTLKAKFSGHTPKWEAQLELDKTQKLFYFMRELTTKVLPLSQVSAIKTGFDTYQRYSRFGRLVVYTNVLKAALNADSGLMGDR